MYFHHMFCQPLKTLAVMVGMTVGGAYSILGDIMLVFNDKYHVKARQDGRQKINILKY